MRDSHSRFAALSSGHRWCPSISCCENAADVKRRHSATMSAEILRSRLPWNAVIGKPKASAPEQQYLPRHKHNHARLQANQLVPLMMHDCMGGVDGT
jgi:hypothetical protein